MSLRNALGNCPYADHLTDWLANHPQFRAALATPARGWCEIHGNYECREDHSALATPATAEKT